MIALLFLAAAADMAQTSADPVQQRAGERCQAALTAKVKGEVSNFAVSDFRRSGRRIHLKGTVNVLRRPVSRPGEMTPMHVIDLRYSYDCRFQGHSTPRIRLSPIAD